MVILKLAAVFCLLALPATAGQYVVICTAPCVASDGTTQPVGTVLNRILASPGFVPGSGLSIVTDAGQTAYAPPVAVPTVITTAQYVARFAPSERTAIMATPASLNLWLTLLAYTSIDVTDPQVTAGVAALVSANLLTAARGAQILNLAVASP